jgi:hypothetical protein
MNRAIIGQKRRGVNRKRYKIYKVYDMGCMGVKFMVKDNKDTLYK